MKEIEFNLVVVVKRVATEESGERLLWVIGCIRNKIGAYGELMTLYICCEN